MSTQSIKGSQEDCQTLKTCDSNIFQHIFQGSQAHLRHQFQALRQMTNALLKYEQECIDKVDLTNAKETRIRIALIQLKQDQLLRRIIKQKQDRYALSVRQQSQDALQTFDAQWSLQFTKVLEELAQVQNKMRASHVSQRKIVAEKYQSEKNTFRPSVKLDSLKRRLKGLMKLHLYQQAQLQAKDASELEAFQLKNWAQKIEAKKNHALSVLITKQNKDFQTLRYKNENLLSKKMKERDRAFEILIKKYQIRQQEVKKTSREINKNSHPSLMSTKRLR